MSLGEKRVGEGKKKKKTREYVLVELNEEGSVQY
jgi:hypothetical protein